MSDEHFEHELTDEELELVLGGVAIGDVNVANLTKSPIKDNTVNVNVVPQVPVSIVNVLPIQV